VADHVRWPAGHDVRSRITAQGHVDALRQRRGGSGGIGGGDGSAVPAAAPDPARFAAKIAFLKEEVFEICGALALGESTLRQLGMLSEAARISVLFDDVEGRLAEPQPSGDGVSSLGS
jgi:hypothetical protein